MPYTERQRRAAFAELGRRDKGGLSRSFKGMSKGELEKYAGSPKEGDMAKGKFPDFLKKGKGKGKAKGKGKFNPFTAGDQAEALRMNEKFDKKKGKK